MEENDGHPLQTQRDGHELHAMLHPPLVHHGTTSPTRVTTTLMSTLLLLLRKKEHNT